ncbi:MAG: cytochrome d ubiquinol oxidase subunit II, partial [Phocaeicola sp.]|nr:cytochrome d ubiquinol oxidase subunit II [Phocaeicola sp.]
LLFFLAFVGYVLLTKGYAVDEQGVIFMEPYKYLHNFLEMPVILFLFILGVVGVLYGIIKSVFSKTYRKGIWFASIGTVLVVLSLFLIVGYNHTSYYPSSADLQSSLTLANSCSSMFTLKTMAYVSVLIPFVLAYIVYAWRALNKKPITMDEIKNEDHTY